ncbi:MAG: hypothetical protein PHD51_03375 [Patescibacteria group bacterium]|nr:hypothetical protein [Patescibacteria group bacterium]MDD5490982.1 hypothetical protein [Patescibacteria group bacterium]
MPKKLPSEQSFEEAQEEAKKLRERLRRANRDACGPFDPFCPESEKNETSDSQHEGEDEGE